MNKTEAKQFCKEVIEDIELLRLNPIARTSVNPIGFLNLCHLKNTLQGYLDANKFPKKIDIPPYDLSALVDHELISIDFKHLHKEKSEEEILLLDEIHQILQQ